MTSSRSRLWTLAGALAPVVYVAALAVGGVLTPGYSQIAGPVGALTMAGAPAVTVLVPLFALYDALLISFAFTVRDIFSELGVRFSFPSAILLAVAAIFGALTLVYPMDPLGVPSTEDGRLHAWFAELAAVATTFAVLFAATSLRRYPAWRRFVLYSLATFALLAVAGLWAGSSAASPSPSLGLPERITVALFLQWLLVLALTLRRS